MLLPSVLRMEASDSDEGTLCAVMARSAISPTPSFTAEPSATPSNSVCADSPRNAVTPSACPCTCSSHSGGSSHAWLIT